MTEPLSMRSDAESLAQAGFRILEDSPKDVAQEASLFVQQNEGPMDRSPSHTEDGLLELFGTPLQSPSSATSRVSEDKVSGRKRAEPFPSPRRSLRNSPRSPRSTRKSSLSPTLTRKRTLSSPRSTRKGAAYVNRYNFGK